MRVLVLGGDGMLGHELADTLASGHEVAVTIRRPLAELDADPGSARVFAGIDARCQDDVAELLDRFRPDAVVNAVGLVKQRPEGRTALPAVEVNTVFPHRLARLCRVADIRLLHVSTDCVFSGRRGNYVETDEPDPVDVYGMSKLLGEVREAPALTLRTSIIGLERAGRATGLVEWFLTQCARDPRGEQTRPQVNGYRLAIYTGLTTMEFARLVDRLLTKHEELAGLWHVAAPEPISKYDLLTRLAVRLGHDGRQVAEVMPVDGPPCDRSLLADRFADATGYTAPGWDAMLDELVERITLRDHGGQRNG